MSDKRTQIIEAAIDLFASNGFWNTPTSKITKHAKVSTGTLFNYFESKDVLIDEVYLQLRQEQSRYVAANFPVGESVKVRTEHIWFRYIDWGVRNPVRYKLLQQMKLSDLISPEAQQRSLSEMVLAMETLRDGIEQGLYGDLPPDFFVHLILSQLNAAVSFATEHALGDMPLTKHITRSFGIFWAGVTA